MKKLLLVVLVLVLCAGCWPFTKAIPEETLMGAKLLKKGVGLLGEDYVVFQDALKAYTLEPTVPNRILLNRANETLSVGFSALKLAVDKHLDALEALNE